MKRYLTVFVVVVAGAGIWYWGFRSGRARTARSASPNLQLIATIRPQRRDFHLAIDWTGRVESAGTVLVRALAAGRILAVDANDNTSVRGGDALFTIGGPVLSARLRAARGTVASLDEQVALAESTVDRTERTVREKVATQGELIGARAALAGLQAESDDAHRSLASLEAAAQLRASTSGTFTRRAVNAGQDVEQGETLAEIVDPSHLRIVATLFPPDTVSLVGRTALVTTDAGDTLSGRVTKVLPTRSPTGGVVVWIEGPGIDGHLSPGETASGELLAETRVNRIAVPRSAIVRDERERPYVFVKDTTGYRKQPVATGLSTGGWVEITSGVDDRDEIVTQGAYELYYRNFGTTYTVSD